MGIKHLEDESSMLYWFPKIQGASLPIPRTQILEIPQEELRKVLDEKGLSQKTLSLLAHLTEEMAFPIFLRSDQCSGKHEWIDTCYVPDRKSLVEHIGNLICYHECAGIMGLPYNALVFREFIPFDSTFCAFSCLPIAKERRYFVEGGKVLCRHPYWPEDAISEWQPEGLPANWRELLAELNREDENEVQILSQYAETFSELVPGYWSVDFAYSSQRGWLLIDAARGELSYHPDCPVKVAHAIE